MKGQSIFLTVIFFISSTLFGQNNCEKFHSDKYPQTKLSEDLNYIKSKIFNVHINPYSKIDSNELIQKFSKIESNINNDHTAEDFLKLVQPIFNELNDEHASIKCQCILDSINNVNRQQKNNQRKSLTLEFYEDFAYLKIGSFSTNKENTLEIWKQKIDTLFQVINSKKANNLIIDISQNRGGNSKVGNILIDYFSKKPYKSYANKFRLTQDYKETAKSLGYYNDELDNYLTDTVIFYGGNRYKPTNNPNRFIGQVYILVGEKTFSSAMMFATIVLDNDLATIIGKGSTKAHPNHFGEIINYETPNTKLHFIVSVKEWIRPSGDRNNNKLEPKIVFDIEDKSYKEVIELVKE